MRLAGDLAEEILSKAYTDPGGSAVFGPEPGETSARSLIEVLLALAVRATVSSLVAGMIYSTSQNTRNQQDLRRRKVKAEVIAARVDGAIRSSMMVLASGTDWLVLWTADSRANQKSNLSEIRRIEFSAANKRIRDYAAPSGLAAGSDTTYELSSDFGTVTAALKGTANFPGETWCDRVTGWQIALAGATQTTRLLGYAITLQDAAGAARHHSAFCPRGSWRGTSTATPRPRLRAPPAASPVLWPSRCRRSRRCRRRTRTAPTPPRTRPPSAAT